MPAYFNIPSSYITDDVGTKAVIIEISGNEKMQVTVIMTVVADGKKMYHLR
jgi:hypothetical protein